MSDTELETKICNSTDTGCDYNCMNCEIPTIEPEDCEYCRDSAEDSGVEYEANFTHINGCWECENCGQPV